ncbi:MAG: small acid-soluble spore protein [Oscillospiraceae bacterium]|nr:small acid-soluble spore protein [Oscillospiraceae bacterium]
MRNGNNSSSNRINVPEAKSSSRCLYANEVGVILKNSCNGDLGGQMGKVVRGLIGRAGLRWAMSRKWRT